MLTWEKTSYKARDRLRASKSHFELRSYSIDSGANDAVAAGGPDSERIIADILLAQKDNSDQKKAYQHHHHDHRPHYRFVECEKLKNRCAAAAAATAVCAEPTVRHKLTTRASAGDLARLRKLNLWPPLRRRRSRLPATALEANTTTLPLLHTQQQQHQSETPPVPGIAASFIAMTAMAAHPDISQVKHQRSPTMPVSPTSEKQGFFKRILHRRQTSSLEGMTPPQTPERVSLPHEKLSYATTHDSESSPQLAMTDSYPAPATPIAAPPIVTHDPEGALVRQDTFHTDRTRKELDPPALETRSIKFDVDTPNIQPRPRADSSGTTRSIYHRGTSDGPYHVGVDTGVGSKARKLSIALGGEDLQVGESPLNDHFSLAVRKGGKKEIGAGGAGIVRLMKSKAGGENDDRLVAVKEFRPRDVKEETEADYERKIKSEYAIAKACVHPNIVRTMWLCTENGKWYHVMEHCQLGDLCEIMIKSKMSYADKNCMFKQLLRGVDYLHSRGIAHRDIKMENVLVTKDGCLKIADFGTGEVFSGPHPGLRNCRRQSIADPDQPINLCAPGWVGSAPYMAPEIRQRLGDYDGRKSDMFSCGVLLMQLMIGGTLWDYCEKSCNNWNIYSNSWDRYLESYPDGEILLEDRPLPDIARHGPLKLMPVPTLIVFLRLCHPDPAKRWTSRRTLDDVIVANYECCQQIAYTEGDDLRKRERKVLHHHVPPENKKGGVLGHLSPGIA